MMKNLKLHIALLLLMATIILPQSNNTQTATQNTEKSKSVEQIINIEENNPKENLKDTASFSNQDLNKRKSKDRFVDKDGDGINDNRCNGFGMKKGKGMGIGCGMGKGKQKGKSK